LRESTVRATTDNVVTDLHLAEIYTRSGPVGLRSAEDQPLDLLPDNDINEAMQSLPRQFSRRGLLHAADCSTTALAALTPINTRYCVTPCPKLSSIAAARARLTAARP
jgi:hypothetical protein